MSQKTAGKARREKKTNVSSIKVSQEEVWAFNVLDTQVAKAMAEAQRLQAARDSYIKLLETKYDAVYNQKTGMFDPKPKTEKPKE